MWKFYSLEITSFRYTTLESLLLQREERKSPKLEQDKNICQKDLERRGISQKDKLDLKRKFSLSN